MDTSSLLGERESSMNSTLTQHYFSDFLASLIAHTHRAILGNRSGCYLFTGQLRPEHNPLGRDGSWRGLIFFLPTRNQYMLAPDFT